VITENMFSLDAEIFSFDVFDTTLTRNVADPTGIFFLMQRFLFQQRGYSSAFLRNFPFARIDAELAARRVARSEEIGLSDIYRTLGRRFALDEEQQHELMAIELDHERKSARPVQQILHVVGKLRSHRKRIVFVTDTYLPKAFVAGILKDIGAYRDGDGLYVSSDIGLVKSTGHLFEHVLNSENCRPPAMFHLGDSLDRDVRPARKIGIEAHLFADSHPTRYEAILLEGDNAPDSQWLWHLVSGTSRVARLSYEGMGGRSYTLHAIGANVAGPLLAAYVIWVLREAEACHLQRLYFLSRDGQILLEIARNIAAKIGSTIELRYLFASRQAWHLPAICEVGEREVEWLLEAQPFLSLRSVSERIGIEAGVLCKQLQTQTGMEWNPDCNLSDRQIQQLRREIRSPQIVQAILQRAREARKGAEGYLRQEGLLDDVKWGIVDLGWLGRLQDSLASLLDLFGSKRDLLGFYFGLARDSEDLQRGNKRTFFFHPGAQQVYLESGLPFINILEILTFADHGLTIGYLADTHGVWRPHLKTQRNDGALNAGLTHLRTGILSFVRALPAETIFEITDHLDSCRQRLSRMMVELAKRPTRTEAEALGDFPFSSDQTEARHYQFAPPLSILGALEYGLCASWRRRTELTHWIAGSRKRSAVASRILLYPPVLSLLQNFSRLTQRIPEALLEAARKVSKSP